MPRNGERMAPTTRSSDTLESMRPRRVTRSTPPADETCKLTRVVETGRLKLAVWTCTEPQLYSRTRMNAYRFPQRYARKWWPGCRSAWYDAHYFDLGESKSCFPGLTQFVVYEGGKGSARRR